MFACSCFAEGQAGIVTIFRAVGMIIVALISLAGAVVIRPILRRLRFNFPFPFGISFLIALAITLFVLAFTGCYQSVFFY
ncbi:MAG: hypothetical protein EOP49_20005 [Sphingobacteriales bacterium]|nr:MAG: hypothetical protein EOP49_20005 [Sphingobacteriales bacterium]